MNVHSSETEFAADSPLEEHGFELVWGFSCQAFFGLLSVLCSERESRSSSRRLRLGSRSARKGARDRNGSKALAACRLAALAGAATKFEHGHASLDVRPLGILAPCHDTSVMQLVKSKCRAEATIAARCTERLGRR